MEKSLHRKEYKVLLKLLYEQRMKAGLRQEELARKLGVHQSFISKTENGDRRIDMVELKDFCEALGTDLATFTQEYQEELRRQT